MKRTHKLYLLPDNRTIPATDGESVANALQRAGISLTLPCGGMGTCGRCIVEADGLEVKACHTPVEKDMTVRVPDSLRLGGQSVLTDIRLYDPARNKAPRVEMLRLELEAPTLDDPVSDASRVKQALAWRLELPGNRVGIEPYALRGLPAKLRENGFAVNATVIYENGGATVLDFPDGPVYGLAVDIGTTTVVTALCDLSSGVVVDAVGVANPQAEYGSDVITRIVYTEENEGGAETMRRVILDALCRSVQTLAGKAGIDPSEIPVMTVAANTVMTHFLLGLPADWLRREPYVPAATEFSAVSPSELGLPINPCGRVLVLPCVSSYVGGDITAGVIASELADREGLNILVDVGTNGEMVLAGEGFMVACSCSAGPAFEGSGVSCGSRAVRGAVDNVYVKDGKVGFDVIGGEGTEATSLCGSGLISILSVLHKEGIIDRAGRFTNEEKSYTLTKNVTINQSDVSNLIRAKAAIYAGMRVLTGHMELSLADLGTVYVAGGFGRSLKAGSAANIGMFPPLDRERFRYVGNSSLAGALRVLCDRTVEMEETAASILNLELSVGNAFMEEFTKACFLPHTDQSFYF